MRVNLFCIIIFCLIAGGCGKTNSPQPATDALTGIIGQPKASVDTAAKGSLTGQVSPLPGSNITFVASTILNGQTIEYRTSLRSDGIFMFLSLPAGIYTVNAATGPEYGFREVKDVKVLSGAQTSVGTITLIENPDNGKIVGNTKPAGAAVSIFVQCVEPLTGLRFEIKPDPITGNFEIPNLPPGKWSVWFAANIGYEAPAGVVKTISAKQIANAGIFEFKTTPPVSTLSMKANGQDMAMDGSATYDGSTLLLSGLRYSGSSASPSYRTYQLAINIANMTGPGTYLCNGTTASKITYVRDGYRTIGGNNYGKWSSQVAGGSATIIITKIDQTTKTITGTFTADLGPLTTSSKGIQNISQGTFTAIYK